MVQLWRREGSLTGLVSSSVNCQSEKVDRHGAPSSELGGSFFLANETTGKSTKRWWFRCSGSANQLELFCRNPALTQQNASPDTY